MPIPSLQASVPSGSPHMTGPNRVGSLRDPVEAPDIYCADLVSGGVQPRDNRAHDASRQRTLVSHSRPAGLPDFDRPPLVEVALSLQFEPLSGLTTAHIGLLWQKYRHHFPRIEEHPPLEPIQETFGPPQPPQVEIAFGNKPPMPRVWFLSEANTELVQIQNDRFIHNWRKAGTDAAYPRYESIRTQFQKEVRAFTEFLKDEQLGTLSINQCEITYVNHIDSGPGSGDLDTADHLFTNWNPLRTSALLPTPEDMLLRWRFRMPNNAGRLHVMAQPAWDASGRRIWTMNLMARAVHWKKASKGPSVSLI